MGGAHLRLGVQVLLGYTLRVKPDKATRTLGELWQEKETIRRVLRSPEHESPALTIATTTFMLKLVRSREEELLSSPDTAKNVCFPSSSAPKAVSL